jgi:tetratricopeptide (TPR) repeat protein
MYNNKMQRVVCFSALCSLLLAAGTASFAQEQKKSVAPAAQGTTTRAVTLAESGHCAEALPLLKRAIHQTADRDLEKRVGLDGLHCAMTHNAPYDSLEFLQVLERDFSSDPEVLYEATHVFSDLSVHTSQQLMQYAPFSYQVRELDAEALEAQGKWEEAAADYRKILEVNPVLPGIHARLGRALLSKPQPSSSDVEQAKKSFEDELDINPNNPTAEYVLGDLAKNASDWSAAIRHFSRASQLDAGFAEAYLGLGESLVSDKRFADAIPPLEKYEKLAPDSPTGHYQLAMAYAGAGRRDDANREAALQRETSANLEAMKRKVAEGLLQQQSAGQAPKTQQPQPPQPQPQK